MKILEQFYLSASSLVDTSYGVIDLYPAYIGDKRDNTLIFYFDYRTIPIRPIIAWQASMKQFDKVYFHCFKVNGNTVFNPQLITQATFDWLYEIKVKIHYEQNHHKRCAMLLAELSRVI